MTRQDTTHTGGRTLLDILTKPASASPEHIGVALASIRRHLGMEIAYISRFVDDRSVFQTVDAPGLEALIKPGDSRPLQDVYCRHILEGRIPELMADTADHPFARAMPITATTPIGAHMSVPIRDLGGRPIGMFCCLSPRANPSLNDRDLQVMRVFADMAAAQITARTQEDEHRQSGRQTIAEVMTDRAFTFAYQPIFDFASPRPAAFEALCRFTPRPYRSPDKWFAQAVDAGLGTELELAVLQAALATLPHFPENVALSVNASPDTILSGHLAPMLGQLRGNRIILEVTEHARVADYNALTDALAPLRARGVRLAIDDAGAGYASLQHIVQLRPDIIKLDMGLTRAVDTDPARRALATALIHFARETLSVIVAEGIETASELATLEALGVPRGQGYYLGRPVDLEAALALVPRRQPQQAPEAARA